MTELLLIPEFTDNATIQQNLYEGAFYLTLLYQQMQAQDKTALTEKDRLYSWWKISDTTYKGHLPIKLTYTNNATINAYTLESDKVTKFGDLLLGADNIELPKFVPNKNVITDVLGAMLINIINGNPELAHSYMQSAFFLASVYNPNVMFSSKSSLKQLNSGVLNER